MHTFEHMHTLFIEKHVENRSGERKARLLRGHSYGEKLLLQNVWWPYSAILITCTQNMKSMIGTANHIFLILHFSRLLGVLI